MKQDFPSTREQKVWGTFIILIAVAIVALIFAAGAVTIWSDPHPGWKDAGSGIVYRCDGTTAAYRMANGDHITFRENDQRCAL